MGILILLLGMNVQAQTFENFDFTGGLNTYNSSLLLKDNESPDLQNVLADKSGSLDKRQGYSVTNTAVLGDGAHDVNNVFYFKNNSGTNFCMAFVGSTGTFSTDGCNTFTTFVSTLTAGNDVNCDSFNNEAFCVNGQYNFIFTGSANTQPMSGPPSKLTLIRVFNNQCFAVENTANPSRLYYSNVNDCTAWNTSTQYIDIAPNNGDTITALGYSLYGGLPIYKKYSTWYLTQVGSGSNGPIFQVVNVSPNIGALNQRSIQNFFQEQLFDSVGITGGQPGIYAFDGIKVYEKSKKIRNSLDIVDTFTSSKQSISFNTQSQFQAGNLCVNGTKSCLSATNLPGLLNLSSATLNDNTTATFSGDTLVSISTNVANTAYMKISTGVVMINGGGESSNFKNWNLSQSGVLWSNIASNTDIQGVTGVTINPQFGSRFFNYKDLSTNLCGSGMNIMVLDASAGTVLYTSTVTLVNFTSAWGYHPINTSGFPSSQLILEFSSVDKGLSEVLKSSAVVEGNYIPLWYYAWGQNVTCEFSFDMDETIPQTTAGSITSPCFDTGFQAPVWGQFNAVLVSSDTNSGVTFQTQVSSSCSGTFDSAVSITPGNQITSANKEAIEYIANFTLNSATNTPAGLSSVIFNTVTTGTWKSAETYTSNTMSAGGWGIFNTIGTTTGAGAITYQVQVSTYVGGTATAPKIVVTPGSAITASTGAYVTVTSTFTVVSATETAQVSNITLNWSQGNLATSPSSTIFQNRYHYGVQSKGGSYNDTVYVLDSNGSWWKWTDMNARSMEVVNQSMVMGGGANSKGYGNIFQLYNTDSDNGGAINAYYNTKDFPLTDITHQKSVNRVRVAYGSNVNPLTLDLIADTGLQDNTYTITTSTGALFGMDFKPVNPAMNANTYRLKFSNNSAQAPFRVLGYGMEYSDNGIMVPQ